MGAFKAADACRSMQLCGCRQPENFSTASACLLIYAADMSDPIPLNMFICCHPNTERPACCSAATVCSNSSGPPSSIGVVHDRQHVRKAIQVLHPGQLCPNLARRAELGTGPNTCLCTIQLRARYTYTDKGAVQKEQNLPNFSQRQVKLRTARVGHAFGCQ